MQQANFHNVHAVYDGMFNAASGTKIDLLNPTPEMIHPEDVAGALSKICRFGGHSSEFYSVAQHSVFVSALVPDQLRFPALMHDAAEAYLGDVIKPLKVLLGNVYEDLEERFMQVICKRFAIDPDLLPLIKGYDKLALEIEHERFQKGNPDRWDTEMHLHGLDGHALTPDAARVMFLRRCYMLTR